MKKIRFILTTLLLLILFLSIQFLFAVGPGGGDLGCDDLLLCSGSATCGMPGHEMETCKILCGNSAEITCPKLEAE